MKINLPKTAKEQKVWLRKLGITDISFAKLAIQRDRMAELARRCIDKRDYAGARRALGDADGMQNYIRGAEAVFKAIK